MIRSLLHGLVICAVTCVFFLLALEVVLRFFPVNTGLQTQAVNQASPVFRFTEDQSYVWSKGWDFSIVNRGRVNNAGFVNDQDYSVDKKSPRLAVIGDSYIEAVMVPFAETLHGRLAKELNEKAEVYSFAASGAPLSQYLAWAAHARRTYRPDAMLFLVIGNDFDESLEHYSTGPGFHHYVKGAQDEFVLKRFDYAPSPLRHVVRLSALARYLYINLQMGQSVRRLLAVLGGKPQPIQFFGNTAGEASTERLAHSEAAVRAFFRDLPEYSGLPPERVIFVLDGIREAIYQPELRAAAEDGYFAEMRRRFMAITAEQGYQVLDMDPVFRQRYAKDGRRFEFVNDGHWSGYGHAVASEAVLNHPFLRSFAER